MPNEWQDGWDHARRCQGRWQYLRGWRSPFYHYKKYLRQDNFIKTISVFSYSFGSWNFRRHSTCSVRVPHWLHQLRADGVTNGVGGRVCVCERITKFKMRSQRNKSPTIPSCGSSINTSSRLLKFPPPNINAVSITLPTHESLWANLTQAMPVAFSDLSYRMHNWK
jgi:hypothetical protein